MTPLGLMTAGEKGEVLQAEVHLSGNQSGKSKQRQCERITRVEEMGIRKGNRVEILNNEGNGPVLLKVENSRIAIGRGMAMKIMVRRMEE